MNNTPGNWRNKTIPVTASAIADSLDLGVRLDRWHNGHASQPIATRHCLEQPPQPADSSGVAVVW